uniref:IS30 family transposase n=3 Tax=Gordonia zhenghanii TaxID=2911516 RepID=UPI0035ABA718
MQSAITEQVNPCTLSSPSRLLTLADRLVIADGLIHHWSYARIGTAIGKHKSTVSREVRNHSVNGHYLPYQADHGAAARRRRPRPRKLDPAVNPRLHTRVQQMLAEDHSPMQVAGRLRREYPDDESMHVSHETIYQTFYLQGRGELKKQLAAGLRSGRAARKPRGQRTPRERFVDPMVNISARPPEVADRAVPGHWEGDLIVGPYSRSAIGTLVERTSRFTMLLHLPNGHSAPEVRDAIIATLGELPAHLRRSLTWDQGCEMARHVEISKTATVYFCDPASPWQRGTNENTNGLLRQYFPKGTDLSVHDKDRLREVADRLNRRPRQVHEFATPAEKFNELLSTTNSN